MTRKDTSWIVVNNKTGRWLCTRCTVSMAPPDMPQPFDTFIGLMYAFIKGHSKCKEAVNAKTGT